MSSLSQIPLSRRAKWELRVIILFTLIIGVTVGYLFGGKSNQSQILSSPFKLGEKFTMSYPDGAVFMNPGPDGKLVPVQPTKRVQLKVDRVGEQVALDPTVTRWSFRFDQPDGTVVIVTAVENP